MLSPPGLGHIHHRRSHGQTVGLWLSGAGERVGVTAYGDGFSFGDMF